MIKGIFFDLDGTLIERNLNTKELKEKLKMGRYEKTILDFVSELQANDKENAESILVEYECDAANKSKLNKGVTELFHQLKNNGIKTALVTRNNKKAAIIVCKKFELKFDVIVSREDAKPKPSTEQLEYALLKLNLKKEEVIFVGDHNFDLESGKKIGIKTGLGDNDCKRELLERADFVVERIDHVIELIKKEMN